MILFTGGAGGSDGSDDCTARAEQVLAPESGGGTAITYESDDEPIEGRLRLTGDADEGYVLSGKTFYKDTDTKRTGTMTISSSVP